MIPLIALRDTPEGCILPVRVHPGARKNDITGIHDGAIKVSITTPPTDGRANDALVGFLAERLHVSRSQITLLSGATSRSKIFRIARKTAAELQSLIDSR